MVVAVGATLTQGITNWLVIAAGLVVGALVGIVSAQRVKMTAMPQMVAIFNGAGGGAASLVAAGELLKYLNAGTAIGYDVSFTSMLTAVIGAISFAGSIVAFLKLQELMTGRPITYPGQQVVNALLLLAILGHVGPGGGGRAADLGVVLDRAGGLVRARRPVRAADRRGRHAGRDLAAQLVHRPGRRLDRLRARQQRADHRRRAGRRVAARCSPC